MTVIVIVMAGARACARACVCAVCMHACVRVWHVWVYISTKTNWHLPVISRHKARISPDHIPNVQLYTRSSFSCALSCCVRQCQLLSNHGEGSHGTLERQRLAPTIEPNPVSRLVEVGGGAEREGLAEGISIHELLTKNPLYTRPIA